MLQSCFFIPLAPSDQRRAVWTIESIRRHCDGFRIFVLADGPKSLFPDLSIGGSDIEVLYRRTPSRRHWGAISQMQAEGFTHALRRADLDEDCIFVKIDADAMVVRPGLVERARKLFRENPACGQLGQCRTNISGQPLLNRGWVNYFRNRVTPWGLSKALILNLRCGAGLPDSVRLTIKLKRLLDVAQRHGYELGEFAIGGAYILRMKAVMRMRDLGWLTDSPFRFLRQPGEDVTITPLLYASGFNALDDIEPDGIFAICGEESWVHPLELCKRGHYIVHPIKYGVTKFTPRLTEQELAAQLLDSRETCVERP